MNLIGLPAGLTGAAVVVAALVSSVLAAFAPIIARIPGLRYGDDSRNVLMRTLVGALNLAGIVGYAYFNNIVLAKEAIPALVLTAFGALIGGHYVYKGVQTAQALATNASVETPAGPGDTVLPFNAPIPTTDTSPPAA